MYSTRITFEISHLPLQLLERNVYFKTLCRLDKQIYLINDHSSLHVLNILQKFVKISIPVSLAEQFTVERPYKVIQSIFLLLNKDKFIRNSHRYYFQMPYICVLVTSLTSCDFPPFQTCRFLQYNHLTSLTFIWFNHVQATCSGMILLRHHQLIMRFFWSVPLGISILTTVVMRVLTWLEIGL